MMHIAIFDFRIISAPISTQVQYTPDDAYYYLGLAKNYATLHLWTFDSGVTTTTGFHPLLALLLCVIYIIFQPTRDSFVLFGLALSAFVTLTGTLIAWRIGFRDKKTYFFLMFLGLVFSTRIYAINSTSIMEWPLVILIAMAYSINLYQGYDRASIFNHICMFFWGMLGSLARLDFGLLPFSFFIVSLIMSRFVKKKYPLQLSSIGLVGAAIGVLIVLGHNYLITGNFLQSSARIKVYWALTQGIMTNFVQALFLILESLGSWFQNFELGTVFLALVVTTVIYIFIKKDLNKFKSFSCLVSAFENHRSFRGYTFFLSAILCIIGYIGFYTYNASIQPWYTANLIIPVFITLMSVTAYLDKRLNAKNQLIFRTISSTVIFIAIIYNIASVQQINSSNSPWPHQPLMVEAGEYLKDHNYDGRIGSWNAGIIGYYQGGDIINIDGLVNDEVYDYILDGQLSTYLSKTGIRYIIDFETMITQKDLRVRGGYDDAAFLQGLHPLKVFDDGKNDRYWKRMTLFEFMP